MALKSLEHFLYLCLYWRVDRREKRTEGREGLGKTCKVQSLSQGRGRCGDYRIGTPYCQRGSAVTVDTNGDPQSWQKNDTQSFQNINRKTSFHHNPPLRYPNVQRVSNNPQFASKLLNTLPSVKLKPWRDMEVVYLAVCLDWIILLLISFDLASKSHILWE